MRIGVCILTLAAATQACKQSGGSSDQPKAVEPEGKAESTSTDTGSGPDAGSIALGSSLTASFPRGLAIDALQPIVTKPIEANTYSRAGAVNIAALALQDKPPQAAAPKDLAGALAEQDALLAGTATHCLDAAALANAVVNPPSGDTCANDSQIRYPYGGTNEPDDEACVVITSRREVERARSLLDNATKLSLAMICQAKKAKPDAALPAVAATLDLGAELLAAANDAGAKSPAVDFARITRLADEDGKPVYRTDIKLAVADGSNTATKEVHLVHSPTDESQDNYRGVIWMQQSAGSGSGKPLWIGVSYAKTGTVAAPRLKFEVRTFDWAGATSPLLASGLLDPNAGASADGTFPGVMPGPDSHNAVVTNISYLNFDINPLDGAGSVSVWGRSDGNFNNAARGLVTTFARGDDGKFAGCGVAGSAETGLSIRASLESGTPLLLPVASFQQISEGVYEAQQADHDQQTLIGATPGCTSAVRNKDEAKRTGQCYLVANDGIYDDQDVLVIATPTCSSLHVLAEDPRTAGTCELRFRGETDDKVYLQCFAQSATGTYGIAMPDGSSDLIKRLTAAEAGAAPFNVTAPVLAEEVVFAQDVRPAE